MKTKILILYFLVAFIIQTRAQNQGNVWKFGHNSGVDFNIGPPNVISSAFDGSYGTLSTYSNEGVASISDANGQLLFYTDGQSVYDAFDAPMTNGTGLLGNVSSTQSGIIVPKPGSSTLYYIFTVDAIAGSNLIKYSIVDMSIGTGIVTAIKNEDMPYTGSTPIAFAEKITAVPKAGGIGFWLIAHFAEESATTGTFIVWEIDCETTDNGIHEHSRQNIGNPCLTGDANTLGYMKVSPDRKKLAYASYGGNFVDLYDFDNATGIIDNWVAITDLTLGSGSTPYGLEFSPNNQFLFVGELYEARIHRYDITVSPSSDINTAIGHEDATFTPNGTQYGNWPSYYKLGALQYGPDGRIYGALPGFNHLLTINSPNAAIFNGASITENGFVLATDGTRFSTLGLPNFVSTYLGEASIITSENACNVNFEFTGATNLTNETYLWDFGDGTPSSTDENPSHNFITAGTYLVTLIVTNDEGCTATATVTVTVEACPCDAYLTNEDYTKVGSDFGLTSIPDPYTIWNNKIYVSGDVLVPSGYKLDITNCDVVFADCRSSISVAQDGVLECNNSTFRPCDLNNSWQGIYFYHESIGDIRECVFKNAFRGVSIESAISGKFNITNNHFINNKFGIHIYNSNIKERITGNTFINEVSDIENEDYHLINWGGCQNAVAQSYFGIFTTKTTLQEGIAMNDFEGRYTGTKDISSFVGISINGQQDAEDFNQVNINANNFNNIARPIEIFDVNGGIISQNIINTSVSFTKEDITNADNYLLSVINSSGLTVEANKFSSITLKNLPSAMYFAEVTNCIIKDNEIKGLRNGINICKESKSCNINNNDIDCQEGVGIWLHDNPVFNVIGCNIIKMNYNFLSIENNQSTGAPTDNFNGIGIYLGENENNDLAGNITIKGNCIFDTRIAVVAKIQGTTKSDVNIFKNNFMYNYDVAGLYHRRYFADIGSDATGTRYDRCGRNSFISNREIVDVASMTPTYDIYSHNNLPAYGNYGVLNVTPNVLFANPGIHHSKASCGLQISDPAKESGYEDYISRNLEDQYDYCDLSLGIGKEEGDSQKIYQISDKGILTLYENYLSEIQNLETAMLVLNTVRVFNKENLSNTINNIQNGANLNPVDALKFQIEVAIMQNEFNTATNLLASVTTEDDYFTVRKIQVKYEKNNQPLTALTASEKSTLNNIINSGSNEHTINLAQNILNISSGKVIHNFSKADYVTIPTGQKWLSMNESHLLVFPNPAQNNISVEIVNSKSNSGRIEICNLLGSPVKIINTSITMGIVNIDVTELSAGTYIICLYSTDKEIPLKSKFVKN